MSPRGALKPGDLVTARVARYDPERDRALRWQTWQVAWKPGLTVLDLLHQIKEQQDGTLAFREACRMGVCGSCGMYINGRPRLACNTQVGELGRRVTVSALPNHDVIKDLVSDLAPTFARHRAVRPYIIRDDHAEMNQPTREYRQTPEELETYIQFSGCITCSLCLAACPIASTNDLAFLGPQALAQAYRYVADSRDAGVAARAQVLSGPHGVVSCHLAGACSEACPKGVDPALAIQFLNRVLLTGRSERTGAPLVEARPPAGPPPADRPVAPPANVKADRGDGSP